MAFEPVLTANFDVPRARTLAVYQERGGYVALSRALGMAPDAVTEAVKKSGLRGRGGAGFPTGTKWGFVPKDTGKPVYLCVNADESEPGTFKDRYLLERDPHLVLEGTLIAAHAIRAKTAFVYFRGEFKHVKDVFDAALREAVAMGHAAPPSGAPAREGAVRVVTVRGAGAYICGEETGLIESLEGKRGYPRIKPPFPAVVGAFGSPTIVNNVETLAALPYILKDEKGAARYAAMGTPKSPGTKLFCVSGPVERPGLFERELGYPLKDLIEKDCGGVRGGSQLKAVVPGGSSVPVLTAAEAEKAKLDYESLAEAGSMLGSAGVIVMDDSTCMVAALRNLARFYSHESCGQCSPCREGTGWAYRILNRMEAGRADASDVDLLLSLSRNMRGKTICVLADALAMPIDSYVAKFRAEFDAHATRGGCAGVHPGRALSADATLPESVAT